MELYGFEIVNLISYSVNIISYSVNIISYFLNITLTSATLTISHLSSVLQLRSANHLLQAMAPA